ncbi:unnamed protein product [Durusdinium trenchii]|uniref:Integrase catalytic domain-containing protein n=1 Tax=Durusdinium trenchii TaxID=1381693 RepID=A0ABP0LW65_9DINO
MARQRQQSQPTSSVKETAPVGHTTPLTTPSRERRSDRTTPQARHETFATFPDVEVTSNPGRAGDDPQEPFEPDAPRRSDYAEVPQDDDQRWTAAEWRDWQRNRWSWWEDSSSIAPWPEEEEVKWEQFEFDEVQILPQELLGWLLLRRSGLPAAARLSVLSAINNKLDLETMERAMRDQEEELLMAEHHRAPHLARPRRSFWVEQDSEWGLLNEPDMDEVEEASIYWVGDRLPPEVYPSWEEPATAWTSWSPDGQELTWTWQEDDFYAQDMAGAFWSWTEYKEWLDAEDMAHSNPDDSENIFAVYAAFQEKMRSFRDSRKLNYAKQHSLDDNETTVLTADGEDTASSLAAVAVEYPGHAVIDLGATESLTSLDALQEIMNLRLIKFGEEELPVLSTLRFMAMATQGRIPTKEELESAPSTGTPASRSTTSTTSSKPQRKSRKDRTPTPEKYDLTRTTGPPADDPRSQGYPCFGNHVPMAPGRGSLTGRNKFGMWTCCENCRLRISYTPAFGATALRRQAGPLPADVTTTIEQLEPQKIKEDPMQLNAKSVGYKGAEDSLHRRLKEIEESKKKNPPRQRPGAAKDAEMPSVHASSAQKGAQVTAEQKKSAKRENDQTPEHEEWSLVVKEPDSPEQASPDKNVMKPIIEPLENPIQDDEKYQNGRCGFLTDSQRTQLCLCAEEFMEEAHSAWQDILPPEDGIDLMEICYNIATSKGVQEIKNMITRWKPKLTWFSLPCGPFSPIQELFNEKDDLAKAKSMERKQKAKKMIKNGLDIATHQLQQGRDVAWEWPSNNRGWNLQLVRQLWSRLEQTGDLHCGHANGCAFGLREEKSGLPIRKPWLIKTTSKVVARAVSRTCPGTAVHPHHQECIGGSVARNSGFYPSALCDVIFKAVKEMNIAEANGVIPACAYPPLNEKEKRGVLHMLERLHKKTGHPSNAALSSCLRHRGAHPEVIQLASKHICPECQELRAAPLHPASSLEKSETLWETLVIHGLESTWILHYGLPGKIRMDPEGAFRSNALGLWAEERGVELLPCAAEDHGQIGIVERSIQTIKATIRQILQGSDCTPLQAAVQSCQAHNQFEKIEGYSPFQWAFGRQPTVTGRFHENGYDDPYWTSVRLRHASERERAPHCRRNAGTYSFLDFHDLAATLFEYEILDDHLLPEDLVSKGASVGPESGAPTTPRPRRSSSVPRLERAPEDAQRTPEDVRMMQTPKRSVNEMPADEGARQKAKASRTKEEKKTDVFREPSSVNPGTPGLGSGSAPSSGPQSGTRFPVDLGRVIRDPGYDPEAMAQGRNMPELFEQPLFKKQRMKLAAETDDELLAQSFFSSKGEFRLGDLACEIELSLPVKASEWRSMKRDALSFFVKKVKGAEGRWHELSPEKKALFKTAKDAEVSQWLAAQAVRKAIGPGRQETLGYVCSHVDDFLVSGDEANEEWVAKITSFYSRFKWSPWEFSSFTHCGLQIMEQEDFSFVLSHSKFIEGIEPIEFEARQDHDPVKAEELTQLRGLQSEISSATVGTLRATNKLLREAFHGRHVSVRVNQLHVGDPLDVCFLGWSDAALANRKDLSSTGGYVIAAASPKMLQGTRSPLSLVSWRSARLQRKARSSLSAETQALAECDQELMFTRLAWAEFCGIQVDLKQPSLAVCRICGAVIVDAKALYDVLIKRDLNSSGAGLKDKYTALEVLCLLESIERNSTIVWWVHSESQIADALTKPLPPGILDKVMVEGSWTLRYDPSFTSSKRLKKAGRKSPEVAPQSVSGQHFWGVLEDEHDRYSHLMSPQVFE